MKWLERDHFYDTHDRGWRRSNRRGRQNQAIAFHWKWIVLLMLLVIVVGVLFSHSKRAEQDMLEADEASPAVAQPQDAPQTLNGLSEQIIRITSEVQPTMVTIINSFDPGLFSEEYVLGSGIIMKRDEGYAYVVTNQHVVDQGVRYEVVLSNGESREAEMVGEDWMTDLAVLRIDDDAIDEVATFGDSDQLQKGEMAIVIGNPLGINFSQSISFGVISEPRLTIPVDLQGQSFEMDVIHTDATINEGNSGGALLNLRGEVVGINSMKIADFGVEGIGFAIPINDAKPIIDSLIEEGIVRRPFIGMTSVELAYYEDVDSLELPDDVEDGLVVVDVEGPAERAGLQAGDVVVALDEHPVFTQGNLRSYLYKEKQIGERLVIHFYRAGKKQRIELELAERDDS